MNGDARLGAVEGGHYLALDTPNEMSVPLVESGKNVERLEHDVLHGRLEDLAQKETLADVSTAVAAHKGERRRGSQARGVGNERRSW